ncbi:Uncharacterised protein [Nocardia cyriacigeorgica]|uniref:Uncharacterized protein n=1 Tax=Nocardia cyriacigeorgica TaxID=135487 RepID=A0A4U8W601_9NOCA|nr:Uncharacterised protein [Nocardia cyriacigeorgica]
MRGCFAGDDDGRKAEEEEPAGSFPRALRIDSNRFSFV